MAAKKQKFQASFWQLMCKQQRKRSPEVSEVLELPNILNRGESRRPRLDEPRKVVPLSEGAPGHDESQSTGKTQIPVDRHCFISNKAHATRVFGCFPCATYRVPVFTNMWRLAEFFGPIKFAKNALLFPHRKSRKKLRTPKLEGVKNLTPSSEN